MKTNLFNTGILFLSLTLGAMQGIAQDDGAPADPSVIARLKAARAAADGDAAPAAAAVTPDATATATATTTPDAGAAAAPIPGATTVADAGTAATTNAAGTVAAPAPVAAAATPATSRGVTPTLAAFDLLWQRNMFDPSRVPYDGRGPRTNPVVRTRTVARVETLVCNGIVHKIGMGYDALFSGAGAPASAVLDVGDSVNGFRIENITTEAVTLVDTKGTNTAKFVLNPESNFNALTRADGGPWRTMYVSANYTQPIRPMAVDNSAAIAALQSDSSMMDMTGGYGGGFAGGFGGQQGFGGAGGQTGFGGGGGRTAGGGGGARGRRGQQGGGAGGGAAGGGGFGGAGGGGNFGFNIQQDTTPAAAPAPADPAVIARLAARRAAGQ